jgi:mutator protein MutT
MDEVAYNPHRQPPPPGQLDVAAGVVFRKGKLLITQRRAQDRLGGLWEFPGGKREDWETFEECLRRELMEELGIEIEIGRMIESIDHQYPEKKIHLRFFWCRWTRHEPKLIECQALAWVGPGQLDDYEFPEADARLLARLKSTPEFWR